MKSGKDRVVLRHEGAVYCHSCERWPAPVQRGARRLCETCAKKEDEK